MTNPTLSIETTKQIGRLYQLPGGEFNKKLSTKEAQDGIDRGVLFPSITNVIGSISGDFSGWQMAEFWKAKKAGASIFEATKAADNLRDLAADRGTAVHDAIDCFLKGGSGNVNDYPDVIRLGGEARFAAFLKFREDYKEWDVFQTEATVYGEVPSRFISYDKFNYAGTVDAIFVKRGRGLDEYMIVDWKCTSVLRPTVGLQLGAVANATHMVIDGKLVESPIDITMGEGYLKSSMGVQLGADGNYVAKKVYTDYGFQNFYWLREVWDFKAFGGEEIFM